MQRIVFSLLLLLVLPSLLIGAKPPEVVETLEGKVIHVTDGDTLTLLVEKKSVRVRLEGIDAPESSQSFGNKAREMLKELTLGKQAVVKKTGVDKYNRTLGFVFVGEEEVNAKMIEGGLAWHYAKYNDESRLANLEAEARKARRGLWKDDRPLAPWEFRARNKTTGDPEPASLVESETPARKPKATKESAQQSMPSTRQASYWLNTSSNVRHNQRCQHFGNTKNGRVCTASEGKACGICGG